MARPPADPLVAYYGDRAPEYEAIYAKPERQADLARVCDWLTSELAGHRILEIACGTGYWTERIAPVSESMVAVDAGEEVLEVARRKTYPPDRVRFRLADAYRLHDVPGSFSAAVAAFWWSHVPLERRADFIAGMHDRLGVGSRVLLCDNRFVAGSSTPIGRRDAMGNTYQTRRLADGTSHEVLKNFPTTEELRDALAPVAIGLAVVEWEYFWGVSYEVGAG